MAFLETKAQRYAIGFLYGIATQRLWVHVLQIGNREDIRQSAAELALYYMNLYIQEKGDK